MHAEKELAATEAPFVSIVTVSLDAARTIEDTLASVHMQQARFAVEHICVDGGSKDGTREIIDQWCTRSPRIRRVFEPDTGIFDAMNKGLAVARGEYVIFINADDFLAAPDVLARAMSGLAPGSANNPGLVVGNVSMGRLAKRGIWRRRCVPRLIARKRGTGFFALHQAMFARKELLDGVGGFDARLRYAADVTQFYDLERRFGPSIRVVDADIAFMQAGGSSNASFRALWRGTVETYRFLVPAQGRVRALAMVLVKTAQSLSEIRYGRPPYERWFGPKR